MTKVNDSLGNRVVFASTLSFTVLFAVWVIFGIVGVAFKQEFQVSSDDFFLLTSIPILTGSLFRVPIGILSDKYGGKNMMVLVLLGCCVPMFILPYVHSFQTILILSFFVGLAGISFAVGNSWIMFWKQEKSQGLALGTFGAGNAGASITKLIAPFLIATAPFGLPFIPAGWRSVPFIFGLLLLFTAIFIYFYAPKDRVAKPKSFAEWMRPLRYLQVWRYGFYYVIFFGAYVALAVTMPKYYIDVYKIDLVKAGLLTSFYIFPASLLRPLGGYLSDKFGPRRVTVWAFIVVILSCAMLSISGISLLTFLLLSIVLGTGMGVGKASNYKLVANKYGQHMGVVGGLVGLLGGLGGWLLQILFGVTIKYYVPMPFVLLGSFAVLGLAVFAANIIHKINLEQSGNRELPSVAAK
ncbi:MAG: MFS transporter [Pseudomonadota bacterium]